jgi:hypothetical protein
MSITFDEITECTLGHLGMDLVAELECEFAIRRGEFYCVRCRKPFQILGPIIYCDCPPPPFHCPFTYAEVA